ncbi:MAG: hypothetical protein IKN17_10435 [Ruminococcus sp.]|nr:hypothetical protein [Ruminococcus sp.]
MESEGVQDTAADKRVSGKTLIPADAYSIEVKDGITFGTVTADRFAAKKGTQITLTVIPDAEGNYKLRPNSPKTGEAKVTKGSEPTKYTFTMPAADVLVSAEFTTDYTVSIAHGTVTAAPSGFPIDTFDEAEKTVTLTVTPDPGYMTESLTVTDPNGDPVEVSDNTFTMPAGDVNVTAELKPDPAHFSQAGDSYTIHDAKGWDIFCDILDGDNGKTYFSGKTVKLDADISVTRMAGKSRHDFTGTFDGQKHPLLYPWLI